MGGTNYFYDLPTDIHENIYFEEHKLNLKDTLHEIRWVKHRGLWIGPNTFVSHGVQTYTYLKKWKLHNVTLRHTDTVETRILLRRRFELDSQTMLEYWQSLRHYTMPDLKAMCSQDGVKGCSKLNKPQLIHLMMTR